MNRLQQILALTAALLFTGSALAAGKPNIILILADDMGWGDAGFNGCTDFPTPAMDSIAKGGARFNEGYVLAPQCAPSRSALLTGKDQNRILANNNLTLDMVGLTEGKTFADYLKAEGYRTGMVGKWHLGDHEGKHPMDRGFDSFFGFLGGGSFYFPPGNRDSIANILDGREAAAVGRYLTDEFGDRAVRFIKESAGGPFFLYLAFNAPHTPMQAPEEEIAKYAHLQSVNKYRSTYAAMVTVMDLNIQKVLDALEAKGVAGNSIVVFLSDNGGPLPKNGSDNGPLRGMKGDTLEGGIRVPFAVKWPGVIQPGTVIEQPVLSIDLLPTALAAAGATIPGDLEGVNLLPVLTGKTGYPERVLHWFFPLQVEDKKTWWWAVRDGDWKLGYFNARRPTGMNPDSGLFNLREDLGEQTDLTTSNPEIRGRLQKLHDQWFNDLPTPFSNLTAEQIEEHNAKARARAAQRRERKAQQQP